MKNAHVVIVTIEAKPGKEEELKQALQKVMNLSKNEDACLEYRLNQDLNNPAQFVLYEHWISKDAHQLQFDKPYIKEFSEKLGVLLCKPYQGIFANEIS